MQYKGKTFDKIEDFYEDRAVVRVDDLYGYIDRDANYILEPKYQLTRNFHDGRGKIKIDDQWGYVDLAGNIVIQPQYNAASNFIYKRALVSNSKHCYGYIDIDGRQAILEIYTSAPLQFNNDHAQICRNDYLGNIDIYGFIIDIQISTK